MPPLFNKKYCLDRRRYNYKTFMEARIRVLPLNTRLELNRLSTILGTVPLITQGEDRAILDRCTQLNADAYFIHENGRWFLEFR